MRAWGYGRPTMRSPRDPGWPHSGRRTELQDIAERWKWDYLDWCHAEERREEAGRPEPKTLAEVTDEYLLHRESTVAKQTLVNDRTAIRHLASDHRPGVSIHALNPQKTLDRMLREGSKIGTVTTNSRFLSSFFKWLEVPYKVKLPKEPEKDIRVWTDEEIPVLRESAEKHGLLLAVDCGLFIGLRMSEIWGLEWEDVDIANRVVKVKRQYPNRPLKGKRYRTTLILPGWEHEPGQGRVVTNAERQQKKLQVVLGDVGLRAPGVLWHSLRHTYARVFLGLKPDMRLLQASLGHSSVMTTEAEYNWLESDKAAEIARDSIYGP